MEIGEPTLLDYYRILQRRARTVCWVVFLIVAFAVVAVFWVTPSYEAEATALLPPKQNVGGGLASLMSGGLAGMLPVNLQGLGGSSSNTADFQAVLESRRITDQLIVRLHLDANRDFRNWKTRGELRRMVRKRLRVTQPTAKVSLFKVTVRSSDPALAAQMANTWMELMHQYLNQSSYRQATKHRRFLEGEVAKVRQAMERAEQQLAAFQQRYRMFSLPDEARVYVEQYAKLEGELLAARATQRETEARLRATGEKLSGLQSTLSPLMTQLEITQRGLDSRQEELTRARERFTTTLADLPAKALDLARLERQAKVQNALYLYLFQQLAAARLDEDKEVDLLLPLDRAEPADRPIFPNKPLLVLLALAGGLLLGLLLALVQDYFEVAQAREAGLLVTGFAPSVPPAAPPAARAP